MHDGFMKTIRSIHLYLGCVFAPMICFFAATGVLQILGRFFDQSRNNYFLNLLSTIHHGRGLKTTHDIYNLSSGLMYGFVSIMALSLVLNVILGVMMAYKFGHRKTATWCLAAGVAIPVIIVAIHLLG